MKFTICISDIPASINATNNNEALFKHQWDERVKETLGLCKLITNRPFPATCLWHLSSSVLMKDLELAEPASLPSTNDYHTFFLTSLTSHTLPPDSINNHP